MKLNYFNYKQFNEAYLLTNDFGSYVFLSNKEFEDLISKKISPNTELWNRLSDGRFIYQESNIAFSGLNKYDIRELRGQIATATSLHIFVVTTACNLNCVYCQANNGSHRSHLVMDRVTAEKAVMIALNSPAKRLCFEFQGGEPLLNFDIVKYVVEIAEKNKGFHQIDYTLVSNLTLITDEMISFFAANRFALSTSIDGSQLVHDMNRPFLDGSSTFYKVLDSLDRVRANGISIGAIETTTRNSLHYPREIVREYSELGFDSIFIRPLTPLGKATVNWDKIGYTPQEFLNFYHIAFDEVLKINAEGSFFRESHAEIFLRRISGQLVNYMELRSPCGAGIGQMAYYPDGNIFTCDEGRMLFEMGNKAFLLGNTNSSTYEDLVGSNTCRAVCASSILETIPTCCDCVYQPFCGTCPVVNYAQNNDLMEKSPRGYKCQIYQGILDKLFQILQKNDPNTIHILRSWSN